RVGSGSERGAPAGSCEGHAAAGEAGAANVEALGQPPCVTPARAGSALKRSRSGTFAAPVLTTRDLVSGRKRKRAWGACWVVRRSCRGRRSRRGKRRGPGQPSCVTPARARPRAKALTPRPFCRAGFAGRGTLLAPC